MGHFTSSLRSPEATSFCHSRSRCRRLRPQTTDLVDSGKYKNHGWSKKSRFSEIAKASAVARISQTQTREQRKRTEFPVKNFSQTGFFIINAALWQSSGELFISAAEGIVDRNGNRQVRGNIHSRPKSAQRMSREKERSGRCGTVPGMGAWRENGAEAMVTATTKEEVKNYHVTRAISRVYPNNNRTTPCEIDRPRFYSLKSHLSYMISLDRDIIVASPTMKPVDLDEFSRLWQPLLAVTSPFEIFTGRLGLHDRYIWRRYWYFNSDWQTLSSQLSTTA